LTAATPVSVGFSSSGAFPVTSIEFESTPADVNTRDWRRPLARSFGGRPDPSPGSPQYGL